MPPRFPLAADGRQSESFVRGVLAASPDCVKVLSAEGVIEFMSGRGLALNQVDALEDVLGQEYATFWPEEEREKVRTAVREASEDKPSRMEGFCPTAKGEPRWWEVRFAAFTPEGTGTVKLVAISRDITERFKAEEARRVGAAALQVLNDGLEQRVLEQTGELRLARDILESSVAPICAFDTGHRLIAFNKAHAEEFERIFGHRVQIGEVFHELFPPDQVGAMKGLMDRALRGEPFTVVEAFGVPGRDKPTWEISYSPLRGPDGTVIGAFHWARNISERLRSQLELTEAQEALRQSQKLEAVGQLTGGVAHDFNNLLTIIRSSVDFLRRDNLAPERRQRYLDAVSSTVERAAKLTGQLLAFARRQSLKPEVFEVGQRLRAVADMVDTIMGARIRLDVHTPDEPCFVRADLNQFETALVNLAVNARDAMDGSGTLTIRLTTQPALPAIRGHAAAPGAFVAVSLHDTGSGISPDQLGKIFEPFFTTKEVGKGTGLGLSQVFGFAKQSGGDVDVESRPGQGTTFTLFLPEAVLPSARESAEEPHATAVSPLGTGQRVLVVEDNLEVGRFATQILEDLGYRTAWAVNAEDALKRLGEDGAGFDVVFSDVVMPGMAGIDLAKLLRKRFPGLPVVLTSGYSHVLAQEGSDGFELLHKPYAAEQLGRLIAAVTRADAPLRRGPPTH